MDQNQGQGATTDTKSTDKPHCNTKPHRAVLFKHNVLARLFQEFQSQAALPIKGKLQHKLQWKWLIGLQIFNNKGGYNLCK